MPKLKTISIAIGVHLAFVALWWFYVWAAEIPSFILPTPWETLKTLAVPEYNWMRHFTATAIEIFAGYTLAVVVGVSAAVIFTWSKTFEQAVMPLLITINMIPKVAMAPLFIVWLAKLKAKHNLPYPILLDTKYQVATEFYKLSGPIPLKIIIDCNGKLRYEHVGDFPEGSEVPFVVEALLEEGNCKPE